MPNYLEKQKILNDFKTKIKSNNPDFEVVLSTKDSPMLIFQNCIFHQKKSSKDYVLMACSESKKGCKAQFKLFFNGTNSVLESSHSHEEETGEKIQSLRKKVIP